MRSIPLQTTTMSLPAAFDVDIRCCNGTNQILRGYLSIPVDYKLKIFTFSFQPSIAYITEKVYFTTREGFLCIFSRKPM